MGLQKGERLPIATHLYQPSNLDNQQQVVLGAVTFGSQSILVKNAILLSQTIIFWLFFIQNLLYSAPVELLLQLFVSYTET